MYLEFKNLKIRSKEGKDWPQSQKESTNDIFRGEPVTR